MDPAHKATVRKVDSDSIAAIAGMKAGDEIELLDGQPLLSTADLQWVLHNAETTDELAAEIRRDKKRVQVTLKLPAGWRRDSDISWRTTTWDLRRIATGGLWLESVEHDTPMDVDNGDPRALRVKHVGEYGEHAAAKRAGFQKGDVFMSLDGGRVPPTESLLLEQMLKKPRGSSVDVTVLRGEEKVQLKLPIQ